MKTLRSKFTKAHAAKLGTVLAISTTAATGIIATPAYAANSSTPSSIANEAWNNQNKTVRGVVRGGIGVDSAMAVGLAGMALWNHVHSQPKSTPSPNVSTDAVKNDVLGKTTESSP